MIVAGVVLLAAMTAGLTAFGAFLLWRDGYRKGWRKARTSPPICPKCGYNLSGLRECRCPECGVNYTLDQLWQSPIVRRSLPSGNDLNRDDEARP